ncbi:MAG: YcaO-like family protein [Marinifilaceae bacterium]
MKDQATLKRMYKAKAPIDTISKIRNILTECGIVIQERLVERDVDGIHSCRNSIVSKKGRVLSYGTNGKGIRLEYAVASAYGELMERMQNKILFPAFRGGEKIKYKNIYVSKNFTQKYNQLNSRTYEVCSDEIEVSLEEVIQQVPQMFTQGSGLTMEEVKDIYVEKLGMKQFVGLPFFRVRDKQQIAIPHMLLMNHVGSNGMCAGNSPEEALMQGLGECFERYVIRRIFEEELKLPNISAEFFKGTYVYDKLIELQASGEFTFLIKDCSLNMQLPVIGLVLVNQKTKKYSVCLGADPSPLVALERCVTELYQGGIMIKERPLRWADDLLCSGEYKRSISKKIAYYDSIIDGTGDWPQTVLACEQEVDKVDWPQFATEGENLRYYTNHVQNLGFDVLIRDVSFLGFPSFYIYVPGMSEVYYHSNAEEFIIAQEFGQVLHKLYRIGNLPKTQLKSFIKTFERFYKIVLPQKHSLARMLNPNTNSRISNLPDELILFVLCMKCDLMEKANYYLKLYLKKHNSSNEEEKKKYLLLKKYTESRLVFVLHDRAIEYLKGFLSVEQIDTLNCALEEIVDFFGSKNWPNCYDCKNCKMKEDCLLFEVEEIVSIIDKQQELNPINQMRLSKLFQSNETR